MELNEQLKKIEKKLDKVLTENFIGVGDVFISSPQMQIPELVGMIKAILSDKCVKNYLTIYKTKKAIGVG